MSRLSLDVLKIRNFRFLLIARMCVLMALQAQGLIVGWQVYTLTKSVWILGLTGLAEAIPAMMCTLFAGYVVDTGHPRKIFTACIGVMLLSVFGLWFISSGLIDVPSRTLIIVLFAGIVLSGFARGFISPATFVMVSHIVARKDYPSATSWQTTAHQTAFIGGPAIGGLLYGGYGAAASWLFPLTVMLVGFTVSLAFKITEAPHEKKPRTTPLKNILEGWIFLFENKVLLSLMALDMLAVLFGGAIALLPAFADQILHVGAQELGILRASPAIGAVFAALYFALKPMKTLTGHRMLAVVAGFGLSMIGFGLSHTFTLALICLTLSGIFDSINMVIRGAMMQILTPDHMRGRVSAVSSLFVISSNELGAFESGVAASLLGLVPSLLFGGAMTLVVAGGIALYCPQFRTLRVKSE